MELFVARPSDVLSWLNAHGHTGSLSDALVGYFQNISELSDGTLRDHVQKVLNARGYTGLVEEMLRSFFIRKYSTVISPDSERAFWQDITTTFATAGEDISGCTFAANYNNGYLDALFSTGSGTATFAATRAAGNPATYVDADGVLQLVTTSNIPRYSSGYYDATGFSNWANNKSGVMIEGASTNYLKQGIFAAGATVGTNWTETNDVAGSPTFSLVDVKSTFNVGTTVQSQRIVYTGVGGDTGVEFIVVFSDDTAVGSFVQTDVITASVWLKGSSDTPIIIKITEKDAAGTGGTSHRSADISGSLSSTEWRKFTLSTTIADADASRVAGEMAVEDINTGTATDIQFTAFQVEKLPFASSFIPTTTAALTRNAETLKYVISGNRTAATESMIIKTAVEHSSDTNGANEYYHFDETDTKSRFSGYLGTGDFGADAIGFLPNQTDSGASSASDYATTWTENVEETFSMSCQHSSPYVEFYRAGVSEGTDTVDDFINPAWGTDFWVGNNSGTSGWLYGTIFSISYFNRVLTSAEHASITASLA